MEEKDVRQWCMFMHMSQLAGYIIPLGGVIVPIVMWQMKKDESSEIDAHGRMVVNALLSYLIYVGISMALCLVLIGFILLPAASILAVVAPIIGGIKANDGVLWKYPLVFKFL
ncbi:MAG: DUF4870 domain-containing protein [Planctomycetota bacterium]